MNIELLKGFIAKRNAELRAFQEAETAIAELETLSSHKAYLANQISSLSKDLAKAKKEAEAEYVELNSNVAQARESAAEALKGIDATSDKDKATAKRELTKIEDKIKEAQKQLDTVVAEREHVLQKTQEAAETLVALKDEAGSIREAINAHKAMIAKL